MLIDDARTKFAFSVSRMISLFSAEKRKGEDVRKRDKEIGSSLVV